MVVPPPEPYAANSHGNAGSAPGPMPYGGAPGTYRPANGADGGPSPYGGAPYGGPANGAVAPGPPAGPNGGGGNGSVRPGASPYGAGPGAGSPGGSAPGGGTPGGSAPKGATPGGARPPVGRGENAPADAPTTAAPDPGSAATSTLAGAAGATPRTPRAPARDQDAPATTGGTPANPGRHRHRAAAAGPGRDDESSSSTGPGRRSRREEREAATGDGGKKGGKAKRKGSFWRELPLLIVVAIVLTFVIQTFLARIYVIPSASMEETLHGCSGCVNDRVAVDKVTYRFSDPAPGDVVVFRGPPAWGENEEISGERSGNVLVRGFQDGLSLIGLAPPNEKDFVKRVIATGGQTVACCDAENRVTVDGRPLTEPYIYYQPGLGVGQAPFDPVTVPADQLWVMGDNRNNSADARVHGPISTSDVIGKARVIVLPVSRWSGVPDTDPQATVAALGATGLGAPGWAQGAPAAAGLLLAVPVVGISRRLRRADGTGRESVLDGSDGPPTGRDPALDGPDAPDAGPPAGSR